MMGLWVSSPAVSFTKRLERYGVANLPETSHSAITRKPLTKPLLIPASNLIADTVQQALDRSTDQFYEPLLIEVRAARFCILDIYTLLLAQSRLFANLDRQLQQINQELEQRVEARTAELLDTNTQLGQEVNERLRPPKSNSKFVSVMKKH